MWYVLQWCQTLAVWVPCFLVWMALWAMCSYRGRRACRRALVRALATLQNGDNTRLSRDRRRGGRRYDAA